MEYLLLNILNVTFETTKYIFFKAFYYKFILKVKLSIVWPNLKCDKIVENEQSIK